MEPVHLFGLLSLQRGWLSARQSVVSQNIANANTPGYKTQDISDFAKVLDRSASLQLATTDPSHQSLASRAGDVVSARKGEPWEVSHSGNDVSLEAELIKAGDVRNSFTMDTNILKTFHSMWLSGLKG
jgi:flagellar basal-body rod protein FlgB